MPLGPFDPIPPREKIRRSHINDLRTALTGIQDAYDVAVANGFTGTVGQWLDSLKGEKGDPGAGLAPIGSAETVDDLPDSGNTVGDVRTADDTGRAYRWDGSEWIDVGLFRGPGGEDTELRARVDPGTTGSDGQFTVWDSDLGRVGWFGMPVLMSGWGPHKIDASGTVTGQQAALNTFFAAAASAGMGAVLMPGTYIASSGGVMIPDNLTLFAHGATLKRDTGWDVTSMLWIDGKENVRIAGLMVDGRRASYTPAQNKHNVFIRGSRNVVLEDVHSFDAAGDAFCVAEDANDLGNINEHITFRSCAGENSGRNGLSLICVRGFRDFGGRYTGSNGVQPQAGVDVEPNQAEGVCEDIEFHGTSFDDNADEGLLVYFKDSAAGDQHGVKLFGGGARNNGGSGVMLNTSHSVEFHGFESARNGVRGIHLLNVSKHVGIYGGEVHHNQNEGITKTGASNTVTGLDIIGTHVHDNGQATAATYDGINLGSTVDGGLIQGVTSTGASQRYGLYTNVNAVNISILDNDLRGNGTGPANLIGGSNRATFHVRGNRGYVSYNSGVSSRADGTNITHGLSGAPTKYGVTGTVAGEIVTVTSVSGSVLTVAIKAPDGSAGTTQNIAWWAEI